MHQKGSRVDRLSEVRKVPRHVEFQILIERGDVVMVSQGDREEVTCVS